jgi:type IV pilus assembly protein PilE
MRGHVDGFSLLELMIALAIIGLLAGIALPGFQSAVLRSQRVEARLALLHIQYLQERHYAEHHQYSGSLTAPTLQNGLSSQNHSDSGNYSLDVVTSNDGEHYVATALAALSGRQAGDRNCQALSIDETGQRRSAAASGVWSSSDVHRCWG